MFERHLFKFTLLKLTLGVVGLYVLINDVFKVPFHVNLTNLG